MNRGEFSPSFYKFPREKKTYCLNFYGKNNVQFLFKILAVGLKNVSFSTLSWPLIIPIGQILAVQVISMDLRYITGKSFMPFRRIEVILEKMSKLFSCQTKQVDMDLLWRFSPWMRS